VAAPAAAQPAFAPFHADGIYAVGERVGWTVTVPADTHLPDGGYHYVIRRNSADALKESALDLSSGSATIETSLDAPGMVAVEITGAKNDKPILLGAAVAPFDLEPSVPRPRDFDAFWHEKLAALAAVPMDAELTPAESGDPTVDLFVVRLASLGSHVRGYLAMPKTQGKHPALVMFQYAGVYALDKKPVVARAAEGWLAIDVDSHDLAPDQATGVPDTYWQMGHTSRETSYFLAMYLRDTRAIDYIATRPDWDGVTLVAMGASMGGQQALAAAGLNSKVTAVIAHEPAGADSNGDSHGRRSGYPSWTESPDTLDTGLYFDVVNFASRIKAPTLVSMGFIDVVTPPVGIWIAFNQLAGPKEAVPMIESNHAFLTPDKVGAYDKRSKELLITLLGGDPFVPVGPYAR
jgi:cephalosporin-C deacetylase-like acetyl esterase